MAMDREEQIGLGAAVGGHALLFIGMALGLFMAADRIVEPKPMTVTIVGEDAVSTAPDPVHEEPAASAPAAASELDSEPAEPEALPVSEPEPQPVAKPVVRETPKPVAKPVTKPVAKPVTKPVSKPVQKTPQKAVTKTTPKKVVKTPAKSPSGKQTAPNKTTRGQAGLGDVVNAASKSGKTGTSTKAGTPAQMTSAQVASAVNVSLRAEIEPLFRRCAPSGVDVSELLTLVTLKIGKDKRLTEVVFNSQSGANDSNRPQAPLHKKCAMDAARAASPYLNLPDEGYAQWASWPMKFKTR